MGKEMELTDELARELSHLCIDTYNSLGRRGKPQQNKEWTVMAAIVQTNEKGRSKVVSMATGTKCLGASQRCPNGFLLNDSHAEVLARRLFLLYLWQQLSIADDKNSIFEVIDNSDKYRLKNGVAFHLVSTETPCMYSLRMQYVGLLCIHCMSPWLFQGGDASIYPIQSSHQVSSVKEKELAPEIDETAENIVVATSRKRKHEKISREMVSMATKDVSNVVDNTCVHTDINRTGAKCVPSGIQDEFRRGEGFHVTGALRIKPGRGERTLSMSCSDKMMKWCCLGVQGGLLSNFIPSPIFLQSIIIASPACDIQATKRAIGLRDRESTEHSNFHHVPHIYHVQHEFTDSRICLKKRQAQSAILSPCSMSIVWCPSCNIYEVANNGRKHGLTKNFFNTVKARTSISKSSLLEKFKEQFFSRTNMTKDEFVGRTYHEYKIMSPAYMRRREEFFKLFPDWIKKSHELESFR